MKKNIFLFIIFLSTCIHSQSLPVSQGSKIKNSFYSINKKNIYFFYPDFGIKYDIQNSTFKKINTTDQRVNKSIVDYVSINDKDYLLDQLGGMVYEFKNDSLYRIDNSFTHKMQLGSSVFVYKNHFYKYGGYGFWSNRNFITKFSFITKQWELVSFVNSKEIPDGSSKSYSKMIGDYLYILGGITQLKNNPLVTKENTEVWRFNMKEEIWENLGVLNIPNKKIKLKNIVDFGDLTLIFDENQIYRLDLKNNRFETFERKGKLISQFPFDMRPFIIKDEIIFLYYDGQESSIPKIGSQKVDLLFNALITSDKIIKNNHAFVYTILILSLLIVLFILFYFIKKEQENRRKIILTKSDQFIYKRKTIQFEDLENKILILLVTSKSTIHSSDILDLINQSHFNYSHQTRILNDSLYKINQMFKTIFQNDSEFIIIRKSQVDKRLKEYSVNKNLFLVK